MKKRRRLRDVITDWLFPAPASSLPEVPSPPTMSATSEGERETLYREVEEAINDFETIECQEAEAPAVPNGARGE